MRSRIGACRIVSPVHPTVPLLPAWSTTRCGAKPRPPGLWARQRPRAALIGMLHRERGLDVADIAALCSGARFAPAPLTEAEQAALGVEHACQDAPAPVHGRLPGLARSAPGAGLWRRAGRRRRSAREPRAARHARQLAQGRARGGAAEACASCAPSRRDGRPSACASGFAPTPRARRIHAEPPFRKGAIEIQDEGSQLAALLARRQAGRAVCRSRAPAPAARRWRWPPPWKTAARSTRPTSTNGSWCRSTNGIARAGARNIQVRTPRGEADVVADLAGRADLRRDRCALHRHRHLAAQPRRQMARPPWRARRAREAAGGAARPRRRAGQARRPHRLHHLLGP